MKRLMKGNESFYKDLKRVRDIMCYCELTGRHFRTAKKYAIMVAQQSLIEYKMSREIFMNERLVMVIY